MPPATGRVNDGEPRDPAREQRDRLTQDRTVSSTVAELHRLRSEREDAERRAHRAGVYGDAAGRANGVGDLWEAHGDLYAAEISLADLGLLVLRMILRHRSAELGELLAAMPDEGPAASDGATDLIARLLAPHFASAVQLALSQEVGHG